MTDKTKILAVTHCSNIVGSVNNLKKISELAHKKNAIVIGDGVSYAPHGFPDVKELGVDFYTFSLYKTYGPHLALLYGKEEILKKLPNQNHEFLEGEVILTQLTQEGQIMKNFIFNLEFMNILMECIFSSF